MHLLFVHDHRFLRGPDGAVYTQGSFPAAVWERYLEHFDDIVVVARDGGAYAGESLARADHPRVRFSLVASSSFAERLGLADGAASRLMHSEIASAGGVIVRLPSDLGLLAASEARSAGRPLLIEVVGCAFDAYANHGNRAAKLYARLAMLRMKRAITRSRFALYVTEHWLQARYPSASGAVTAHASNVVLEPCASGTLLARDLRLAALQAGSAPVIGTVASLSTASKGLQTMFAALAMLREQGFAAIDYRILGPGDPASWQALAARYGIADWVRFDGSRAAGTSVLEWLDDIDLHSQPSLQEGLPRATIEAMSRGCASIGSTVGGLPELLPGARLHRPGDASGLARLLASLIRDPKELAAASAIDRTKAQGYLKAAIDSRRSQLFARFAQSVRMAGKV